MNSIAKRLNKLAKMWGCNCRDSASIEDAIEDIVKNAPFGVKTEMVEIVPEQSVTGEYSGEPPIPIPPFYRYAFNNPNLSPLKEEGTIYIVSINGISYEVENKGDGLMIYKDDELFFVYNRIPEDMFEGGQWDPSLGETITLAIYEKQEVVKQLDPKFVGGVTILYVNHNSGDLYMYKDENKTVAISKDEFSKIAKTSSILICTDVETETYIRANMICISPATSDVASMVSVIDDNSEYYYWTEEYVKQGGGAPV